jgi:hypothetical protein
MSAKKGTPLGAPNVSLRSPAFQKNAKGPNNNDTTTTTTTTTINNNNNNTNTNTNTNVTPARVVADTPASKRQRSPEEIAAAQLAGEGARLEFFSPLQGNGDDEPTQELQPDAPDAAAADAAAAAEATAAEATAADDRNAAEINNADHGLPQGTGQWADRERTNRLVTNISMNVSAANRALVAAASGAAPPSIMPLYRGGLVAEWASVRANAFYANAYGIFNGERGHVREGLIRAEEIYVIFTEGRAPIIIFHRVGETFPNTPFTARTKFLGAQQVPDDGFDPGLEDESLYLVTLPLSAAAKLKDLPYVRLRNSRYSNRDFVELIVDEETVNKMEIIMNPHAAEAAAVVPPGAPTPQFYPIPRYPLTYLHNPSVDQLPGGVTVKFRGRVTDQELLNYVARCTAKGILAYINGFTVRTLWSTKKPDLAFLRAADNVDKLIVDDAALQKKTSTNFQVARHTTWDRPPSNTAAELRATRAAGGGDERGRNGQDPATKRVHIALRAVTRGISAKVLVNIAARFDALLVRCDDQHYALFSILESKKEQILQERFIQGAYQWGEIRLPREEVEHDQDNART